MPSIKTQEILSQLNYLSGYERASALLQLTNIFVNENKWGEAEDAYRAAFNAARSLDDISLLESCRLLAEKIFNNNVISKDEPMVKSSNYEDIVTDQNNNANEKANIIIDKIDKQEVETPVITQSRVVMSDSMKQYHKKLSYIIGSLPIKPVVYMYQAGIPAQTTEGINGPNIETFKILIHNNVLSSADARAAIEISKVCDVAIERVIEHLHILKLMYNMFTDLSDQDKKVFTLNLMALASAAALQQQIIKPSQAPVVLDNYKSHIIKVGCRHTGSKHEIVSFAHYDDNHNILGWVYLTPIKIIKINAYPYHRMDYQTSDNNTHLFKYLDNKIFIIT